mgnify:CR=1 FL=1
MRISIRWEDFYMGGQPHKSAQCTWVMAYDSLGKEIWLPTTRSHSLMSFFFLSFSIIIPTQIYFNWHGHVVYFVGIITCSYLQSHLTKASHFVYFRLRAKFQNNSLLRHMFCPKCHSKLRVFMNATLWEFGDAIGT